MRAIDIHAHPMTKEYFDAFGRFIQSNERMFQRTYVAKSEEEMANDFRRMDHFLGRSDDMVKVRGVNVNPMACLGAIQSDDRTTGEWVCLLDASETDGVLREDMTVHVEARRDAGSAEGLKEHLEGRLKGDLGIAVKVELVPHGSLDEIANVGGREGKAKRLVDRRPQYRSKPA